MSGPKLLRAVSRHVAFMRAEPAASAAHWRGVLTSQLRGGGGGSAAAGSRRRALREEEEEEGSERLVAEYAHLLSALSEKRKLQILDSGAETIMSPQELTRLAARRVGLDVPEEYGAASGQAGQSAARKLNAVRDRLEAEHARAADGGAGDEEARNREERIRAVSAKAQAALAAEQFRRSR
jgi:hypothetical protein